MGAIARRLEPASAAINAMTIPLRIQPVRCMACELPCASMFMFTFLDIIACSESFGRRYRTRAIGYNKDMTSVDHPKRTGCRLRPEYDRHSGSARSAGGAATRQSPSDDAPAHADRSAQSPPPAAGTGCSALTVLSLIER